MSRLEYVHARDPQWLRNGKPLAEDDHLMTHYPKHDFDKIEGFDDGQLPDKFARGAVAGNPGVGSHSWDWDPRNGPDPQKQVGTSPPYPGPFDPPDPHKNLKEDMVIRAEMFPKWYDRPDAEVGVIGRIAGREPTISAREQLLMDAAATTGGARNTEYGDPIDNLTMTGELKKTFHYYMERKMGPAETEAIDMVLTKLGRLGRGAVKRDTYMDAAAYMAIAYEVAMIEMKDWS